MASSSAKIGIRVVFLLAMLLFFFYVGRPLYWKVSAAFQEVREKSVKDGVNYGALTVDFLSGSRTSYQKLKNRWDGTVMNQTLESPVNPELLVPWRLGDFSNAFKE